MSEDAGYAERFHRVLFATVMKPSDLRLLISGSRPLPLALSFLGALLFALCFSAEAGQAKAYRVGVILQGGVIYSAVDGLREGLKELKLEEKKDFLLEIRDATGDLKIVEEAARNLERDKVNLIFAINTSVARVTKRATAEVPIVFCAGTDPVALGLVDSFAKPGGRLTGVHFLATDLTAKRLEILKDIQPKLRRVMTLYNPANPIAAQVPSWGVKKGDVCISSSLSVTSIR